MGLSRPRTGLPMDAHPWLHVGRAARASSPAASEGTLPLSMKGFMRRRSSPITTASDLIEATRRRDMAGPVDALKPSSLILRTWRSPTAIGLTYLSGFPRHASQPEKGAGQFEPRCVQPLPHGAGSPGSSAAPGYARSCTAVTPFRLAQRTQQYIVPSASTPWPTVRQPQCSRVGASAWIALLKALERVRVTNDGELKGLIILIAAGVTPRYSNLLPLMAETLWPSHHSRTAWPRSEMPRLAC
jgi:hypothetical protein